MSENTSVSDKTSEPQIISEEAPSTRLHGAALWVALLLGVVGIFLNVNQLFNLQFFVGKLIIDTSYYYLLAGIFLGVAFLIYPAHHGARHQVSWYDWLLFMLTLATTAPEWSRMGAATQHNPSSISSTSRA